ncbi:hypothetical protein KKB11_01875 [Candidatus Micrarchaeota archaeon]|nr:hypothetical protein [Candidatus Micrarchaeota archaeon]
MVKPFRKGLGILGVEPRLLSCCPFSFSKKEKVQVAQKEKLLFFAKRKTFLIQLFVKKLSGAKRDAITPYPLNVSPFKHDAPLSVVLPCNGLKFILKNIYKLLSYLIAWFIFLFEENSGIAKVNK